MALTQESVLGFLLEHGGKVRNSELVNQFRSLINSGDPAEKQHNRELFKKLVNSVAVVRQIDEVKFVVVRKRYQDFVKEEVCLQAQMEQSFCSLNTSNNARRSSSVSKYYSDDTICAESLQESRPLSAADSTTVKVLNISEDQQCRAGKSGAVFAVIAVRSPERDSAAGDGSLFQMHQHGNPDKPVIRVSSLPSLTSNSLSQQRNLIKEPQCWKSKQIEINQAPGSPPVRAQNRTLRQADDAKYTESVPLEPMAHKWLVKCAAGLWGQIYTLLLQDTRLAQRKDFMSGFTALHWAAKDGSWDMIHKLMDVSSKRGTYVNVNSKAHGGYTPLHIAAMHGHAEVIVALVQRYGASVNERDNDGKKALHYLDKGASAEVRALLGGPQQSGEKTEDEEYKEHARGFNTISKLFHPHLGKKRKTCRFAHEW